MSGHPIYHPIENDKAMSLIGEGVHTGLRKAVEGQGSAEAWQAINNLPVAAWEAVLAFCVEGMDSMGYCLCREEQPARRRPTPEVVHAGAEELGQRAARLVDQMLAQAGKHLTMGYGEINDVLVEAARRGWLE